MWQHLCSNGAKGVFHSSAQLFVNVVVMCSHSFLDTAPKELSEVEGQDCVVAMFE
jgi:hypothetical protein